MASGLIPGMGANVPRGVGAIGRDYNIQLDKVEKYRQQGTWTEEDEKEWAKKKPFLCEICGDRVSSKVNTHIHKIRKKQPRERYIIFHFYIPLISLLTHQGSIICSFL